MSEDQREVVAFLKDPFSYCEGADRVEVLETHVSLVFLAGDHAYKLKRAVKFPYLNFSTPELRRQACEAELTLNRRTAPALYEEVRGLFRSAEGGISFEPGVGRGGGVKLVEMEPRLPSSGMRTGRR